MNVHQNARMTVHGRLLLVARVREQGWRVEAAALAAGVSVRTAYKWLARHRAGGERALHDRSSAPARSPRRLPLEITAAIERLRRQRLTGPQIARRLGGPSTVGLVLRRLGLGRLAALEPRPAVIRYQRAGPGELLHIDTKKLGRIERIGHRITGNRRDTRRGAGWEILHVAIDDAARLAYSEILPDERRASAIAFLDRALAWFARHGVTVERVMTDNGSAYRSHDFRRACAEPGSATCAPGPTRRAPTARPSASSRRRCANGPMPDPMPARASAATPSTPGCTTTTTTAPMPASTPSPQPLA